jgi:peptide/nickel transport system permease protein
MAQYVFRRLLLVIPTVVVVSLVVFSSVRLLPGDVVLAGIEEDLSISPERLEEMRESLGLNVPFWKAYPLWLMGLLKGDLGESLWTGQPVSEMVAKRLPLSIEMAVLAVALSTIVGIPLGILQAIRQDTWSDYLGRIIAISWLAIPSFWAATLLLVLPSLWWGYFPPLEYLEVWESPFSNIEKMFLPAIALAFRQAAAGMRMTRSTMLEVLRQDYMRTATAKGLRESVVVARHGLKNAMIPVLTILGTEFGFILGGTVISELVFGLPGLGRLTIEAVNVRDYTVIQGVVLVITLIYVGVNLSVDLLYGLFDPRIRYS